MRFLKNIFVAFYLSPIAYFIMVASSNNSVSLGACAAVSNETHSTTGLLLVF